MTLNYSLHAYTDRLSYNASSDMILGLQFWQYFNLYTVSYRCDFSWENPDSKNSGALSFTANTVVRLLK